MYMRYQKAPRSVTDMQRRMEQVKGTVMVNAIKMGNGDEGHGGCNREEFNKR
jgi:hypothetical protein